MMAQARVKLTRLDSTRLEVSQSPCGTVARTGRLTCDTTFRTDTGHDPNHRSVHLSLRKPTSARMDRDGPKEDRVGV